MDPIRRALILVLFPWVLLASTRAADESPTDVEARLEMWLQSQSDLDTWRATFRQIRKFPTLTRPLETSGVVTYMAPGQFRWELGTPPRTIAVRWQETVTLYYPRLKRAEIYPLGKEAPGMWKDVLGMLSAGFARSRAGLEERFEVVSLAAREGGGRLVLRPRDAGARRLMPEIRLEFSGAVPGPTSTEFLFADGTLMRNEFQRPEANPEVSPDYFLLELPDDVRLSRPLSE